MAFTVTPTSGAGPYSLTAVVTNAMNVDNVNFSASIDFAMLAGSCPVSGAEYPLAPNRLNSLLAGETIVLTASDVPSGSCRSYILKISDVSTGVVLDSFVASIDNV